MFQETMFTDRDSPPLQPGAVDSLFMSRPARTSLTQPVCTAGALPRRPRWFLPALASYYSVASTRYSEVRRRGRDSMSETTS